MHDRHRVWPLLFASEMQALDRETIGTRGIPGEVLMESAGRALVEPVLALRRRGPRSRAPVRALCGAGNNGGDGFVAVRHLHTEGIAAEAVLIGDPERLPPDAAAQWTRLEAVGATRRVARDGHAWDALLDDSSVAIDALFGTGLVRPIEGRLAEAIRALNAARARGLRVLAVDLPSGISADTGQVLGTAVEADGTVTISLPKIGLALEPGRRHAGRVTVARIGIADPDPERVPRVECWSTGAAAARLPARPADGHKGRFGHVLVASGSRGKMGAVCLAARAALRAGAGLVTVAVPDGTEAGLARLPAEAMTQRVACSGQGCFDGESEKVLCALAQDRDIVALGPGLGRASQTGTLVERFLLQIDRPAVIDADGLFALRGALERLRERRGPTILTPHPGEAATLLESTPAEVNADRIGAAGQLCERSGAVVVLKGAGTVVADPDGRRLVVSTGGPALATGGTGDVLTGIVAALLGQGLAPFEAAGLAAWWHGAAADRLAAGGAQAGWLASEVADALPATAAALRNTGSGESGDSGERGGDREGLVLPFPDA